MISLAGFAAKRHQGPPGATVVAVPGGILLGGVAGEHVEEIADRLTLWVPERARAFDADRGEWVIVEPFADTARAVILTTIAGTVREFTASNYTEGLAKLRAATGAGRVAA